MSKYYLTPEIKPQINKMGNVAYTADDVLFDWTAFEIPTGTCILKSFTAKIMGTNAVAANAINLDISPCAKSGFNFTLKYPIILFFYFF